MRNRKAANEARRVPRLWAPVTVSAVAGLGVMGLGSVAHATPSGLTFYPATDIYPKGNWHFDADYFGSTSFNQTTFTSMGLERGLGPEKDGFLGRSELGLDFISSAGFGGKVTSTKRLWLNAKTQLFNSDANKTRLVAGMWGFGQTGNLATGNTSFPPKVGYILGSKAFSFGRVHLGLAHAFANDAALATPARPGGAGFAKPNKTYVAVSYDRTLNAKWVVCADYYSGKSAVSTFSPGVIYNMNDKSDFELGLIHFNDNSIAPRNQIYVGFDYNFGGAPAAPAAPATPKPDAPAEKAPVQAPGAAGSTTPGQTPAP